MRKSHLVHISSYFVLLVLVAVSGAGASASSAHILPAPPASRAPSARPSLASSALAITRSQLLTIANLHAPPRGVGLMISAHFPPERLYRLDGVDVRALTAAITPSGEAEVVTALPAHTGEAIIEPGVPECLDPVFEPIGPTWSARALPMRWMFRASSTPASLSKRQTIRSLRAAHQIWSGLRGNCTASGRGLAFSYRGETRRRVGRDRHNVVDFGPVGEGALAIAYVWFRGDRIIESDLRFKRQYGLWANAPSGRRYHLLNAATHEVGHQVGLGDLGFPHTQLTMYGFAERGESDKTTLGWGDVVGAEFVSP